VGRLVRGQPKELEPSRPETLEFHPKRPKKSSEPGNVIDFVAAKVTGSPIAPCGASPTDELMALVKLASLAETRWHAVATDCASRDATLGTIFVQLERTSAHLFIFQRALYCPAHRGLRHGTN